MAFSHLHFDDTLPYGRILRSALRQNEQADRELAAIVSLFGTMIDGDGTLDAHYNEVTSRFGFPNNATAHSTYNELQSTYSKTSGNGNVVNSRAARDQLFALLRG